MPRPTGQLKAGEKSVVKQERDMGVPLSEWAHPRHSRKTVTRGELVNVATLLIGNARKYHSRWERVKRWWTKEFSRTKREVAELTGSVDGDR